jgi:esterase/lipase superfamily enzyme
MATIHFATNRNLLPGRAGFGHSFNTTHPHELRFGEVSVPFTFDREANGTDQADALAARLDKGAGKVTVYPENLDVRPPVRGSARLFEQLKASMDAGADTLVYVHGFNVTFAAAIAYGLVLQERLRAELRAKGGYDDPAASELRVVCFTWPSDGAVKKYLSDRDDAAASGLAFSRGFQRMHEFLQTIPRRKICGSDIHLLCHSMGNFVLENTVWHLRTAVGSLPRVFTEVVLAAADVDSDALERENKLGRLHELGHRVTVYFNRGDLALTTSDTVKGNPDRLGQTGPKHPLDVPTGTVNVDCSDVVGGVMEHSYYMDEAFADLAATLRGTREDLVPGRAYVPSANAYRLA